MIIYLRVSFTLGFYVRPKNKIAWVPTHRLTQRFDFMALTEGDILARPYPLSCWQRHRRQWIVLILVISAMGLVAATLGIIYAVRQAQHPLPPPTPPREGLPLDFYLMYALWRLDSHWTETSGYDRLASFREPSGLRVEFQPADLSWPSQGPYPQGIYFLHVHDTTWYLVANGSSLSRTDGIVLDPPVSLWSIRFWNETLGHDTKHDVRTAPVMFQHLSSRLYLCHDYHYSRVFMSNLTSVDEDSYQHVWTVSVSEPRRS